MRLRNVILYFLIVLFLLSWTQVAEAKDLKVGDKAPEFSAVDDSGRQVSLKDFHGKNVVLYFYPKDNTPGCTIEAKSFRDNFTEFQKKNTIIIGVSYDSQESHQIFKAAFDLPFILLVDKDKAISKAYGVDGLFFANRTTFIIGPQGNIKKIYHNVNPSNHAEEVLLTF